MNIFLLVVNQKPVSRVINSLVTQCITHMTVSNTEVLYRVYIKGEVNLLKNSVFLLDKNTKLESMNKADHD